MSMTFTGEPEQVAVLEAGRQHLSLSYQRLWVDYFALGGNQPLPDIEAWLTGNLRLPAHDYDVMAHALNEQFSDRGLDHPIPYSGEI
jgi:hypothetical protein